MERLPCHKYNTEERPDVWAWNSTDNLTGLGLFYFVTHDLELKEHFESKDGTNKFKENQGDFDLLKKLS